ncbi:Fcf1-domain-containing protein [Mycena sp. CBHHK59/15]|nr:Fcf1-domain-containing protein [Mycena sp. CBHHK59/15]
MRQKRAKAYRKLMALYSMSFGFRQPYQVLVDSEMCKSAVDAKIELAKQLAVVLQGDIKPMITQCCIHELYLQQKTQKPAVDLAKTFERRKCNHREPVPGDDCLASVVGEMNKHRYVIATQSQPLRVKLRTIPAVPIVHVNRSVMVLEPPSDTTLKTKENRRAGPPPVGPRTSSHTALHLDRAAAEKEERPEGAESTERQEEESAERPRAACERPGQGQGQGEGKPCFGHQGSYCWRKAETGRYGRRGESSTRTADDGLAAGGTEKEKETEKETSGNDSSYSDGRWLNHTCRVGTYCGTFSVLRAEMSDSFGNVDQNL